MINKKLHSLLMSFGIDLYQPIGILTSNSPEVVAQWYKVYNALTELFGTPAQYCHRWNWYHDDIGVVILPECYLAKNTSIELKIMPVDLHPWLAKNEYEKALSNPALNVQLPRGENANLNTVIVVNSTDLSVTTILNLLEKGKPLMIEGLGKQATLYQVVQKLKEIDALIVELQS